MSKAIATVLQFPPDRQLARGQHHAVHRLQRVRASDILAVVRSRGVRDSIAQTHAPCTVGERLHTVGSGYRLHVEPGELDADRFEQLYRRGAELPAREAATVLREALALWRGPVLADLRYEAWAQPEIRRLEELRALAIEDRIKADLELGQHALLVAELDVLVRDHPLRERLRAQQMLALYRAGRHADALAAFREARATLDAELGLEPGPELRQLETAILVHDPSLAPRAAAEPGVPVAPRRRRSGVTETCATCSPSSRGLGS
jgi:DNA-binding SARP family transcriptional activator